MESVIYSAIGVICVVAFVVVTYAISDWVWFTPKRLEKRLRQQGFKGNPYRLLFGDMREQARMVKEVTSTPMPLSNDILPRLFPILHETVKIYGKKSFEWFGPKLGVNIMDPELIKEVLTNNFKFQKPKMLPLLKLLIPGLIDYDGEKWVKHRRIVNPAFSMEKLKHKVPAIYSSCMDMLNKWNYIVRDEGIELDVWPHIEALTIDVISRTAFGSNFKEGKQILESQREQSRLVIESLTSSFIPGYRFMPTKKNRRMKAITNEVNASLMEIIKKRLIAIENGEPSKDDLLGILLDSNSNEIKQQGNDKKFGMTMNEIVDECKLFYFTGQETSAVLLAWTLILLSWHQDWQQRAREEVLQVFGHDIPNFDNLHRLKLVNMILHEVLRLYSPVYAMIRTVHEETKLGELSIPSGTLLFLHTLPLHHDPEFWGEDAKQFKPERFSDGVSNATKNQFTYLPFSWGPRTCIGQNFAMLEAKMELVMLLKQFTFELSPSYAHAPFHVITVQPQYGAHLIIRKLQSNNLKLENWKVV